MQPIAEAVTTGTAVRPDPAWHKQCSEDPPREDTACAKQWHTQGAACDRRHCLCQAVAHGHPGRL